MSKNELIALQIPDTENLTEKDIDLINLSLDTIHLENNWDTYEPEEAKNIWLKNLNVLFDNGMGFSPMPNEFPDKTKIPLNQKKW
jgi:hypothetical protein